MPRKIKSVTELPNWFSLDNYSHLEQYDDSDWLAMVSLLMDLKQNIDRHANLEDANHNCSKERLMEDVRAIGDHLPSNVGKLAAHPAFPTSTSLSMYEAFEIARYLDSIIPAQYRSAYNSFMSFSENTGDTRANNEDENLSLMMESFDSVLADSLKNFSPLEPLERSMIRNKTVSISLLNTDNNITTDFYLWLAAQRAIDLERLPPVEIGHNDFKKWIEYQLVPLATLTLWSSLRNVDIRLDVLAEVLYPRRSGNTVDFLRKTTKPALEKWIGIHTCHSLLSCFGR